MPCHAIISDEAIKDIFAFGNFKAYIQPHGNPCGAERCGATHSQSSKSIFIDWKEGEQSLLQHCCIHNVYCKMHDGTKKVIYHRITIHPNHRKNGLVKKLHYRSEKAYKELGFDTISLLAIKDGVIAWHRLGFAFDQIADEQRIFREFRQYYKDIKSGTGFEFKSLSEVQTHDFFDNQCSFTDWLAAKGIASISMSIRIKP
ncbi:MAG: GNAT family N-acetyltransferase [Campylobacterales bacterium]|nr:GNAT family N-acetyltransferase [Campylobacterales bacterium]